MTQICRICNPKAKLFDDNMRLIGKINHVFWYQCEKCKRVYIEFNNEEK